MGKTQTIEKEANINAEFSAYLDDLKSAMKKRVEEESGDFDAKVEEYYQGADMNILMAGEKWDFRQTHISGVDNIEAQVREALESVFGSAASDEGGGMSSAAVEAFKTILSYKASAISVATAVIVGAMKIFSTNIEIKFSHQYQAIALAPGLTMHLTVANDSYSNAKFLDGERIVESYLRYKLVFSYRKGFADFGIDEFNAQNAYLAEARADALKFKREILTGLSSHTLTLEEARSMKETAAFMDEMVDEAQAKVQELINSYMLKVPSEGDGKVRALPMGREELALVRDVLSEFQA